MDTQAAFMGVMAYLTVAPFGYLAMMFFPRHGYLGWVITGAQLLIFLPVHIAVLLVSPVLRRKKGRAIHEVAAFVMGAYVPIVVIAYASFAFLFPKEPYPGAVHMWVAILVVVAVGLLLGPQIIASIERRQAQEEQFANKGTTRRERELTRTLNRRLGVSIVETVRLSNWNVGGANQLIVFVDLSGGNSIPGGYVHKSTSAKQQADEIYEFIQSALRIAGR